MNSLADLNAILFDQIQKIQNDDQTDEELEKEIKKSSLSCHLRCYPVLT